MTAWLALLAAPHAEQGLFALLVSAGTVLSSPFSIEICPLSFRLLAVSEAAYVLVMLTVLSSAGRNERPGEEHGSASFGNAAEIAARYRNREFAGNRILTEHVMMSTEPFAHMRNLNTMVCGGSGAGKTRYYVTPNILSSSVTSLIVTDPKSEILRSCGSLLEKRGYRIRVLDLIDMEKSQCYNPFRYLKTDADVQKLATSIFENTKEGKGPAADPFWDNAAEMLLKALLFYLWYEAPEHEQNFATVMFMLKYIDVSESSENYLSPLDILFMTLKRQNPEHMAVKYYDNFLKGAGKTKKSIIISLLARLEKFNLKPLERLTATDEMELETVGEIPTALFCIIPDSDTSFNFLVVFCILS